MPQSRVLMQQEIKGTIQWPNISCHTKCLKVSKKYMCLKWDYVITPKQPMHTHAMLLPSAFQMKAALGHWCTMRGWVAVLQKLTHLHPAFETTWRSRASLLGCILFMHRIFPYTGVNKHTHVYLYADEIVKFISSLHLIWGSLWSCSPAPFIWKWKGNSILPLSWN